MCLILFAYKKHPKYPLIVAANRDEFFKRPTAPAHFWEDETSVLAGRDLDKMGTWMGVTKKGRFASITNYRDPSEFDLVGKKSRGELVKNALTYNGNLQDYMISLSHTATDYPGYNLLAGDIENLFYYSNKKGSVLELEPGIYGLSNHLLNSPWPKVEKGKASLAKIIDSNHEENMENDLFSLLQYADPFPDEHLPSTGVPLEMERMLSPLYITSPDYGTRSSTVLFMSENEIKYIENIVQPNNKDLNRFQFHY